MGLHGNATDYMGLHGITIGITRDYMGSLGITRDLGLFH